MSQQDAIQAVEDLCVGVSLHNNVGHRHLHCSPEAAQPALNYGHYVKLDEWGEAHGVVVVMTAGDGGGIGIVEREQKDAVGAIVHGEAEELIMLQVPQHDTSHYFHERDWDSFAV